MMSQDVVLFCFLKVYIVSPTCCFINGDREVLFGACGIGGGTV